MSNAVISKAVAVDAPAHHFVSRSARTLGAALCALAAVAVMPLVSYAHEGHGGHGSHGQSTKATGQITKETGHSADTTGQSAGRQNSRSADSNNHQQHMAATGRRYTLPPLPESFAQANARLHENTAQLRGNAAILVASDPVPRFALYDQESQPVLIPSQWQGKYVVISFIFTRCQVAAMCPAATAKMVSLQRELDEKGLGDQVQLLSISFDPRYDSPEVLKQYANLFGAKSGNYSFLTGDEQTINDVLRRFGVLTQQEDGTINHSMATVLIDPNGNLAQRQIGSGWTIAPFLYEIENASR